MRADHVFREGEAVPLEVVIKMIEGAGAHQFWMIDPHSIKIPEMFVIPVKADSAISLFAEKIKTLVSGMGDVSLVSPDMGGIRRLDLLSEELGGVETVIINKDRDLETGNVSVAQVKGTVKKICFIVDDIIATGGTVIEAVSSLKKQGAEKVYIMGTHPVFVGDAVKGLENAGAEKVFVTDSIYLPEEKKFKNLETLTLADTIATQIRIWHAEFV
jgi:ribose-phosphate pyrophosphokinase